MHVVQALEPFTEEPSSAGNREVASSPIPLAEPKPPQPSAQPAQVKKAVAAEHHGAEPIPALIKTVAVFDGSEVAPLPATETGSGANPDETTRSPRGHGNEYEPSDPDFPLFLDLGPEPSLSEGLSRPKPRSVVDQLASPTTTVNSARRLAALWLWGSAALTTTILILVGLLAILKPFSTTPEQTDINSHSPTTTKVKSGTKADRSRTGFNTEPPIIVRTEGANERQFPAQKLVEALQTAMGGHGWVELRNREPLRLTADQTLNFGSGRGRLIIRAAPGFQPVIDAELRGSNPLLTTGSGVPLELSGLTINVHYPQQGVSSTPPAVIVAAGSAKIDRCAFKVTGDFHPIGSRALVSNGGVLDINRSWFQGFDETINATAMNRTPTRVRQTMIVPAFRPIPAQAHESEWYGWGIKLDVGGGTGATTIKNPPPHLIMEHCTVEAAGLIDLTNAHPLSVLNVEVNHCAIKAEALLACRRSSPAFTQLHWQGVGNQYNILGRVWIVLSAREGTPAISSAAIDLQSWLQFASGDRNTIQDKLKFLTDPKARTALDQPGDLRIQAPVGSQALPGADPALVGPWSKP